MNRSLSSALFHRKALALRARLVSVLLQHASHAESFAAVMRGNYGVADRATIEKLRTRARSGDVDWLPKVRFATDTQLGGQTSGIVDGVILINDVYVHANDEALRLYLATARPYIAQARSGVLGFLFRRFAGGSAPRNLA